MATFTAYFDVSGAPDDPNIHVFTVAGFIAREDRWAAFEKEWRAARDAVGLSGCLHMKEFAHFKGEFKGWRGDEPRRIRLLSSLSDLIGKYTEQEFSLSLLLDHYRTVDKAYELRELANPYPLIASVAVSRVRKWMRKNHPTDSLLFVFEYGDAHQDQLRMLLRNDNIPEPTFTPKEWEENGRRSECSPLQAADFIAYEHAKAMTDTIFGQKRNLRGSMLSLARKTNYGEYSGLGLEFLKLICASFNLKRRPEAA